MNLDQINIKNFILALFKRDDGERILLGSGAYEFDADLQHFAANIIANDVIEKQGTDGQLLAGQVRRSAPQSFDGYVGDATTTREDTENYRRAFIRFFQPRHFYTVIYILPDGSAIQRKNGYLTDAPAVPEQYQRMPRYHVALAFEDLNYYSYAEDAQGDETYAQTVSLQPESELTGGLVWESTPDLTADDGIVWTDEKAAGKNLLQLVPNDDVESQGLTVSLTSNGGIHIKGTATDSYSNITMRIPLQLPADTYTFSIAQARTKTFSIRLYREAGDYEDKTITAGTTKTTFTLSSPIKAGYLYAATTSGTAYDETIQPMLEKSSTASTFEPYRPAGGAVWDAETGHATTTFNVNGLYAVNPIWTVSGPAESPLIENTTNGTSLSYLGQIPAGQSLIIDCGNQTATLAGANVKNNVRGTWQTFEPGQITIRYSGANITGPSNLKWNEVVG